MSLNSTDPTQKKEEKPVEKKKEESSEKSTSTPTEENLLEGESSPQEGDDGFVGQLPPKPKP